MVSQSGGVTPLYSSLNNPFIQYQGSLLRWGSEVRRALIFPLDVSVRIFQSTFSLTLICRTMCRMKPCLRSGSCSVETLVSTSLHVSSNIHAFILAYCALVLGIAWWRETKIPSSLYKKVGGWRGIHVCRPGYLVCFLRMAPRSHPMIK